MNPPKRKFTVSIRISSDTWDGVLDELQEIYFHFDAGRKSSVSGGVETSHIIDVEENPGQTPERYLEQLKEYLRHQEKEEKKS